jgi:hypothetical protein
MEFKLANKGDIYKKIINIWCIMQYSLFTWCIMQTCKYASVKLLQMYFKNVSQKHKKNFFQGKCEICKRVL